MVEIEKQLKALRLEGMLATLESRALQAGQGNIPFVEALSWLLQDEMDHRSSGLRQRRFKASGLNELKTLTDFDWGFNPKLPKKEIYELVTAKFIQNGEHALLVGAPGTGKSHIAKTIAHAAIQSFAKTVYREAYVFFEDMFEAEQLKKKKRIGKTFSEADLLVIDDLFLRKKMPADAADYLLDVIIDRYSKRKSTLITSNRPIEDWGRLLNDNAASSAILDRLLHHGHLLKFEGKSYRLKEAASRLSQKNEKKG
ncbi:MAG: ATP-binding protein [Desulfobacterales bacterium CG23_combo_of_CG06-09_8_20_14_all_51_8]|nr:MAG: ATP-binding protein [Desulfobacterales bacterium CG23_combo_of_CG06-09_8_20_14_all_51_8]